MKSLRRYHQDGAHYFITAVSFNRRPILLDDLSLFLNCWNELKPLAWVLIPDHFHAILDVDDSNISTLMHGFKITYSKRYGRRFRLGRVWQNRFWDHLIRNDADLNHHLDYIHYNPVKHGLTPDPFEYLYSTLNEFFVKGMYERNWGVIDEPKFSREFGE